MSVSAGFANRVLLVEYWFTQHFKMFNLIVWSIRQSLNILETVLLCVYNLFGHSIRLDIFGSHLLWILFGHTIWNSKMIYLKQPWSKRFSLNKTKNCNKKGRVLKIIHSLPNLLQRYWIGCNCVCVSMCCTGLYANCKFTVKTNPG